MHKILFSDIMSDTSFIYSYSIRQLYIFKTIFLEYFLYRKTWVMCYMFGFTIFDRIFSRILQRLREKNEQLNTYIDYCSNKIEFYYEEGSRLNWTQKSDHCMQDTSHVSFNLFASI